MSQLITITTRPGLVKPNVGRVKNRLSRIMAKMKAKGELSILLCGDEEMRRLNSRYRAKDYPTDVLSFVHDGPTGGMLLGDIVVALPVAQRQAKELGNSFERELLFLLVHGLLHLLGYDHEGSKEEAEKMYELQRKLMEHGYAK